MQDSIEGIIEDYRNLAGRAIAQLRFEATTEDLPPAWSRADKAGELTPGEKEKVIKDVRLRATRSLMDLRSCLNRATKEALKNNPELAPQESKYVSAWNRGDAAVSDMLIDAAKDDRQAVETLWRLAHHGCWALEHVASDGREDSAAKDELRKLALERTQLPALCSVLKSGEIVLSDKMSKYLPTRTAVITSSIPKKIAVSLLRKVDLERAFKIYSSMAKEVLEDELATEIFDELGGQITRVEAALTKLDAEVPPVQAYADVHEAKKKKRRGLLEERLHSLHKRKRELKHIMFSGEGVPIPEWMKKASDLPPFDGSAESKKKWWPVIRKAFDYFYVDGGLKSLYRESAICRWWLHPEITDHYADISIFDEGNRMNTEKANFLKGVKTGFFSDSVR